MKTKLLTGAALAAAFLFAGCANQQLAEEGIPRIEKKLAEAKSLGAIRCAPIEYATAEANLEHAKEEDSEGDYRQMIADYIGVAEENADAAIAKSKSCPPESAPPPAPAPAAAPAPAPAAPASCGAADIAAFKIADGNFATDKFDLSEDLKGRLGPLVDLLKRCPGTRVRIAGHTDSTASDEYNMTLSRKRANSVRLFLIDKGIQEARLEAVGFGEAKPIAPNNTKDGRAKNRRVEFTVIAPEATK